MTNTLRRRIFYCGMVNTLEYAAMIAEPLHIGAGSNKMTTIVRAMRDSGNKAYLVSMPVLGRKAHSRHVSAALLRSRGTPQIFLPVVANRYVRKICAFFGFGWFCVAAVSKADRVIIYNHAVEYLLGLAILAFRGNRPVLDVEDAVRVDETGWQGFLGRSLFSLFTRLTCKRKLIVSQSLANALGLQQYCVVYGAITSEGGRRAGLYRPQWNDKNMSGPIRIHYGGSLCVDTGVDLFCDAVDLLTESLPHDFCQVDFIVTGFGSEPNIRALQRRCIGTGVRVSFYPDASPAKYLEEFCRCQAALCLKLPESAMAMTTFPSKVVEITSHGLLLISTQASDIPHMFDARNAVLLTEASPQALADAIVSVLADPQGMQQVAARGQTRAMELFESKVVGKRVAEFVLDRDA